MLNLDHKSLHQSSGNYHPQSMASKQPNHRLHMARVRTGPRSEEHTSELQSLMRISYAVFCLKKKNNKKKTSNMTCNSLHKISKKSTHMITHNKYASRRIVLPIH